MSIHHLISRMESYSHNDAVIYKDNVYSYKELLGLVRKWDNILKENRMACCSTVTVLADYSPDAMALIIALIMNRHIISPLSPQTINPGPYFDIAHSQYIIKLSDQKYELQKTNLNPHQNALLNDLISQQRPGLVLFTSGSTGEPKAVLHDFNKLLKKFSNANKQYRTLCFLMFDHIAGIDTYFYSLFSGGTAIIPSSRNSSEICNLIEKCRVEVLPTSPTFLNLLLLSEDYKKYDLSSLKIITFGSERISGYLLEHLKNIFKAVRFIQKYGVTELGSPPSKSNKDDTTWIKIDSDNFKTKIIDNTLYIKADTAMIGYLNADSPFTEDGWFNTGDDVEVNGEYIRILGRKSEIINVGGEKVYPVEVENTIQEMDNVAEVTVYGEKNPILGEIVCARVRLFEEENPKQFIDQLKQYCSDRMGKYKIPVKVKMDNKIQHTNRYKKKRMSQNSQSSL